MSISFSFHSISEFISTVTQYTVTISNKEKDAQFVMKKVFINAN